MASAAKISRGKCNSSLWTKEKTLELIALFESRSDLWNVSSQLYSNRNHKQNLQREIAETMQIDATEVAAKLYNLRCQYNADLRKFKVKKSGSGTDELYVPRWEFFNALKFLTNGGQSCRTTSNLQEEIPSEDVSMSDSELSFESVSPSSLRPEIIMSQSGSYRKKRAESKSTLQKDTILSNAMKILGSPADSHQIFGDYIADQLRNMTEAKQKKLKLLIQKAVIAVEEEPETIIILSSNSLPKETSSPSTTSTPNQSQQILLPNMFDDVS